MTVHVIVPAKVLLTALAPVPSFFKSPEPAKLAILATLVITPLGVVLVLPKVEEVLALR